MLNYFIIQLLSIVTITKTYNPACLFLLLLSRFLWSALLAHASPSLVLYSSETKLSCDATKGFKGTFHWFTPSSKEHSQSKDVTVKAVTHHNAGSWACIIKNENGERMIVLNVDVTVVGRLLFLCGFVVF